MSVMDHINRKERESPLEDMNESSKINRGTQAVNEDKTCDTCRHEYVVDAVKSLSRRRIPVACCAKGGVMTVGQTSCPKWMPLPDKPKHGGGG